MIRAALLALLLLAAPALADEHDHGHNDGHEHHDDHDDHDHDDHDDHGHDDDDHHVAEIDGVRAVHAWANATAGSTVLVFVDIENGSEETVTLLGAQADIAASAQLVALENVGGELRYTPIPQMPIAAGTRIVLAPNGLAVQLSGLSDNLVQGGHFEVTLVFDGAELPIVVEIESASATQHSHAGHAH